MADGPSGSAFQTASRMATGIPLLSKVIGAGVCVLALMYWLPMGWSSFVRVPIAIVILAVSAKVAEFLLLAVLAGSAAVADVKRRR